MRKIYTIILLLCLCVGAQAATFASQSDEKRYQAFIHATRCMVCQNQNIAESNSMFAENMKIWLQEAIESGQTDYEIKAQLIERFGDSVFYEPPFQANTYLLWGLPLIFVMIGMAVIGSMFRPARRGKT